jgi:hypothetical protein
MRTVMGVMYRVVLPAVLLLAGWVIGWLQFGANRGNGEVSQVAASRWGGGAMRGSSVESRPRSPSSSPDWGLPDDKCEPEARHIRVFDRLYYENWGHTDAIVDFAIVNLSSQEVTLRECKSQVIKIFHDLDDSTGDMIPETRSARRDFPPPRLGRTQTLGWDFEGWIKGDEHIAPGGVSIVRFRLPKENLGNGGYADDLLVKVAFGASTVGSLPTRHSVFFAHQVRGAEAYGEVPSEHRIPGTGFGSPPPE